MLLEYCLSHQICWIHIFERNHNNGVLQKIARVILCDPVRIRLRSQLLQVIANEEKLLQVL